MRPEPDDRVNATFLGHPRGLATLFFTEMWERFTYYGMRAVLVLFLVSAVAQGGFGIDDKTATAIYGLYTAGVYLAALPGGWIADRLIGARRAVLFGGIGIALGNAILAASWSLHAFYLGLFVIVLGVGLLKPNVSAMVADLYPEGGARLDAGFTVFYMGINLGATLGPFVTGEAQELIGPRAGFGAAGLFMALGLVQYHFTQRHLGDAGRAPPPAPASGGSGKPARRPLFSPTFSWPPAYRPRSGGARSSSSCCSSAARCSGRATNRRARPSTCSRSVTRTGKSGGISWCPPVGSSRSIRRS